MAITINSIAAPTNLTATLTAGGSLLPNTTYYVVVCAKNENTVGYYTTKSGVFSDASIEISFTTTTTELSAIINWVAVIGALAYNVYLSRTSGVYVANNDNSGRLAAGNGVNSCTINTYTITSHPTVTGQALYVMDTIGTSNLPFNISKNLGTINVQITGNETLLSIYNAIVAAGFGNYVYFDGTSFLIKGHLRVVAGATGSLTILNTNIFIAQGTLLNESTSFNLTIGKYNAITDAASDGCNIFINGTITFSLVNINLYASTIKIGVAGIILYLTIGVEITMGANVKYCNFYGVRNTNTNWSNNSVFFPVILRAWGNQTITNAYYDSDNNLTYYPPNGATIFRDCTFKINNSTRFAEMTGLAGQMNLMPANLYDCNFIGAYYKSINDLIFAFGVYQTLTGFNFYYSINGIILDEQKNLLNNANIKGYDKDGTLVLNVNTVNGIIPKTDVKVLAITPTGNGVGAAFYNRTFYSPFTLVISKQGYETYTTKFDLVKKFDEIITLKPIKPIRKDIEGNVYKALLPEKGSDSKLFKL